MKLEDSHFPISKTTVFRVQLLHFKFIPRYFILSVAFAHEIVCVICFFDVSLLAYGTPRVLVH